MLVLQRKCGEEISIAGGIVIRVVSVSGGRVRLGVEAPRSIGIRRGEVFSPQPNFRNETSDCDVPRPEAVWCRV